MGERIRQLIFGNAFAHTKVMIWCVLWAHKIDLLRRHQYRRKDFRKSDEKVFPAYWAAIWGFVLHPRPSRFQCCFALRKNISNIDEKNVCD